MVSAIPLAEYTQTYKGGGNVGRNMSALQYFRHALLSVRDARYIHCYHSYFVEILIAGSQTQVLNHQYLGHSMLYVTGLLMATQGELISFVVILQNLHMGLRWSNVKGWYVWSPSSSESF